MTFALFTAPTFDIEAEVRGSVAALLCLWRSCKKLADGIIDTDIGGRVGGWRAPDGRLIDSDYIIIPTLLCPMARVTFSQFGSGPKTGRLSGVLGRKPARASLTWLCSSDGMSLEAALCRHEYIRSS
jgi:hypothetical protein